jgi:hypothetical protein
MKKLILRGAIVTCALLVGALTTHAQITYEFTADSSTSQYNGFDGSTITIDGTGMGGVEAFSFLDPTIGFTSANPYNSTTSPYIVGLNYVTYFDTSGWNGVFEPEFLFFDFDATGTSMSDNEEDPFDPLAPPYSASATGTWSVVTSSSGPNGSIPDTAGTFWLLMGGMALLGLGRLLEPVRRK